MDQYLQGPAHHWYHDNVIAIIYKVQHWSFEDIIEGLFNCFVLTATMNDAQEAFKRARFHSSKGIQSFHEELKQHAQNMAHYPSMTKMLHKFINELPSDYRKELIQNQRLSPEVHSL